METTWIICFGDWHKTNIVAIYSKKSNILIISKYQNPNANACLLSFTLFCIWLTYDAAEYHVNAHSGYPPISMDLKAFYSMGGTCVY